MFQKYRYVVRLSTVFLFGRETMNTGSSQISKRGLTVADVDRSITSGTRYDYGRPDELRVSCSNTVMRLLYWICSIQCSPHRQVTSKTIHSVVVVALFLLLPHCQLQQHGAKNNTMVSGISALTGNRSQT